MVSTANSRVFIDYDPHSPPPHPGDQWTRFVCISDTHNRSLELPKGDVLLHAGDLTSYGMPQELRSAVKWIMTLPHQVKILIAGNHDLCLDKKVVEEFSSIKVFNTAQEIVRGEAARKAGILYLEHEATEFICRGRRWKVYGSPAAPEYSSGAFQYRSREIAEDIYSQIPIDTDILLTHTPPHGIHDLTKRGKHAGCPYLFQKIQTLDKQSFPQQRWRCKLHAWGHIHEARGASIAQFPHGERVNVNAAVAWVKRPIIVDIRGDDRDVTAEESLSYKMVGLNIHSEDK